VEQREDEKDKTDSLWRAKLFCQMVRIMLHAFRPIFDADLDSVMTMPTSKVTSFLFVNPIHPVANGILLHILYYHARFPSKPMGSREEAIEALGVKTDKAYAWKRRHKRVGQTGPRPIPGSRPTGDRSILQSNWPHNQSFGLHFGSTGLTTDRLYLYVVLPLWLCNLFPLSP
jgi:hypothetical protein